MPHRCVRCGVRSQLGEQRTSKRILHQRPGAPRSGGEHVFRYGAANRLFAGQRDRGKGRREKRVHCTWSAIRIERCRCEAGVSSRLRRTAAGRSRGRASSRASGCRHRSASPAGCGRRGGCGWGHSRLVSGGVYVPAEVDGRRVADKKFGWIHPCVSYPLSDITLEVFPTA